MFNNFDPRAAIFVCNRWDLVPEKERDAVADDTFKKLTHCWPELDEAQVFHLSTTKAWSTKVVGYVAEDYSKLLDGIQRLIPRGLQRKLEHSHRFSNLIYENTCSDFIVYPTVVLKDAQLSMQIL